MRPAGNLLGVVLSGGESRRMGRDKGLLDTGSGAWVLRMGEKLAQQQLPVIYSINKEQFPAYSAILPADRLVVDAGEREGPLNGLFSVHRGFPRHDLLLVACDMQDLDAAALTGIIAAWRIEEADAYAYEVEGVLQPF
ncbi:MAG TPA: NTP transferase domain-containing protein, partial [Puia sp.]|nr:NTP transferase domain-containing protein [Puia sp.]